MGLLQYALISSIAWFAFYQNEVAVQIIASILLFYSLIFYYFVATVMMTIKEIAFDWESGINQMWQTRVIMGMGMAIMYMQGYIEVFFFVLPFFVIGFVGDIFSTLLLTGRIALEERDRSEKQRQTFDGTQNLKGVGILTPKCDSIIKINNRQGAVSALFYK